MKRAALALLLLCGAAALALDWREVAAVRIPAGEVASVAVDGETVWKSLPYDAEVEYVESTGAQYVDTGLGYFADFEIDIKLRESVSNRALGIANVNCMQRDSATNPNWKFTYNSSSFVSDVSITQRHVMTWKSGNISCDGVVIGVKSKNFPSGTMSLFGAGTMAYPNIIYGCKLYNSNGVLVRDYQPVRIGSAGALYDRVSGDIYQSATATPLVAGPDKE